jgi:hypothetical protein
MLVFGASIFNNMPLIVLVTDFLLPVIDKTSYPNNSTQLLVSAGIRAWIIDKKNRPPCNKEAEILTCRTCSCKMMSNTLTLTNESGLSIWFGEKFLQR